MARVGVRQSMMPCSWIVRHGLLQSMQVVRGVFCLKGLEATQRVLKPRI